MAKQRKLLPSVCKLVSVTRAQCAPQRLQRIFDLRACTCTLAATAAIASFVADAKKIVEPLANGRLGLALPGPDNCKGVEARNRSSRPRKAPEREDRRACQQPPPRGAPGHPREDGQVRQHCDRPGSVASKLACGEKRGAQLLGARVSRLGALHPRIQAPGILERAYLAERRRHACQVSDIEGLHLRQGRGSSCLAPSQSGCVRMGQPCDGPRELGQAIDGVLRDPGAFDTHGLLSTSLGKLAMAA
mmetsp:Transcript_79234/g.232666  ORF Transcript_79234/g.232666 Transcript_79234/m.232666 type:complete len:246 (+) Transcript_79234:904-1641(+)